MPASDPTAGSRLVRGIRKWDYVALVLNSIVGAGIFGLPSRAYALAGVESLLAYVVCAVPVLLIVLCFAEVSSRFKDTGGPYLYARATFGRVVGFEVGWLTWLARISAFAALCNLFADYFSYFLPGAGAGAGRALVMTVVVLCLTGANLVGIRIASIVGNIFTVGKLVPLVLLVVVGFFFLTPENYVSVASPSYSAFSASVLILVFAFTGFEIAVIPAGEGLDPRQHLPFALLTGTMIAVVLYVLIQAVCIGTLPNLASSERPLADVGRRLFGGPGAALISLGALVSVTGTLNAIMLAAPRLLFAMGEQGQLPLAVSATHTRFHTPHVAILLSAAGMLVLTLSGTFASAATLSTIIRLVVYGVTCAALPVLRRKAGHERAAFTVPAGGVVSVAALILIAWLFSSSSRPEILQTGIAGAVGLLLCAVMAARQRQARRGSALASGGSV
jgi:APA family basic amino acid/polyamine antiporter